MIGIIGMISPISTWIAAGVTAPSIASAIAINAKMPSQTLFRSYIVPA